MKDTLEYKGFLGSVHFSSDDEVFYGKIEGINNLVNFEGNSVSAIKKSFIEAVEDYISICSEQNIEQEKSFKGSFNVRIPTELHRKAYRKSIKQGISLNQLVVKALEKETVEG